MCYIQFMYVFDNVCIEIEMFLLIILAVIATSQVPAFLKNISPMSDTVLLFKEDPHPVIVIRDVRSIIAIVTRIIGLFRTN